MYAPHRTFPPSATASFAGHFPVVIVTAVTHFPPHLSGILPLLLIPLLVSFRSSAAVISAALIYIQLNGVREWKEGQPENVREIGFLPFPVDDVMCPGETKALHLYEVGAIYMYIHTVCAPQTCVCMCVCMFFVVVSHLFWTPVCTPFGY